MFRYDSFGKLTYAKTVGGKAYYTYDATGNITEIKNIVNDTTTIKTLEYDTTSGWKDRLMKVDGKSLVYSSTAPGLPTTYQNGRTYTLAWNGTSGELTRATVGGNTTSYGYFYGGLRKTKTSGGVTKNYYYDGDRLVAEKWSTGAYLLYHYDENSDIYAITYSSTGSGYSKYYLIKNIQGDVVQLRNVNNSVIACYDYDAWGNLLSVTNAGGTEITSSTSIALINPIRYRGYYYDNETGFYYLQSRYYDPANCRFISADNPNVVTDHTTVTDKNLFAYCDNNPIMRVDVGGDFWETVFDVITLGASIVEVCVNPADPLAWAGLAGDAVDLIPFVTGVGEITRAVKTTVKVVDKTTDVVDTAKTIYKTADVASDIRKATGSYEILYKSGKNYIGKGGFNRAIDSSIRNAKKYGDEITTIMWKSAPNDKAAFIDEYLMQKRFGGVLSNRKDLLTYNKIWSPGRRYFGD